MCLIVFGQKQRQQNAMTKDKIRIGEEHLLAR